MSALGAKRTRRDGGNDVNDSEPSLSSLETPQCSIPLRYGRRGIVGHAGSALSDSEHFRSRPRTFRLLCGRLSVRWTGLARPVGRQHDVRRETAGVHDAARRRGGCRVAARGARAAGRAHAARRILASIRRERSRSAGSGRRISPRSRGARLDREPQYPNRASIFWRRSGSNPSLRDRVGALTAIDTLLPGRRQLSSNKADATRP